MQPVIATALRDLWSLRLSRFAAIGILSTTLYAVLALLLAGMGIGATKASVAAFLIACAVSYSGHKYVTYLSPGSHAFELPRFLLVSVAGLLVVSVLPALLSTRLGLPAIVPVLTACLIIPAANYLVFSKWVFAGQRYAPRLQEPLLQEPLLQDGAAARSWLVWSVAVILIGVASYVFNEWRWGTVADTSWLITLSERMASGEKLYVDLHETNPPFSIWLYMIPERAAAMLGVSSEAAVRLYVLAACLLGSALTGWMLLSAQFVGRQQAAATISLFAATTLLAGNAFSEREQIGALLALPLFVLAAWRSLPAPRPPVGIPHWLVAGLGGGVLAMVKPHFVIPILAAAGWLVAMRRDPRLLVLPEFLISGAMAAAYVGVSYWLYPEFFHSVLPVLQDTYLAHGLPFDRLLVVSLPWLGLPIVYLCRRNRLQNPEPADFIMIASAASLVPFFLQGKGWPYHAYPAMFFGSAALLISLTLPEKKPAHGGRLAGVGLIAAAILAAHFRFADTQKPDDGLVMAALDAGGGSPTVAMLGGGIENAHPLSRMINGRWIEPYCSDWLPTYAAWRYRTLSGAGDQAGAARQSERLASYLAEKRQRLLTLPPDILIVANEDALVPLMIDEFGFRDILEMYERIHSSKEVELFRRKAVGALERQGLDDVMTSYVPLAEAQDIRVYLRSDYRNN